jgi:hypothetical protein
MPQWGKNDAASNSVLWGVAGYNKAPTTTNRDAFYDNVSRGSFVTNLIVGQFGVDSTEIAVASGNVAHITLTNNGSGYTANASVTITVTNGGSGATANAIANTFGKIASVNVVSYGGGYKTKPTITIGAPAATSFNANSAVTAGAGGGANSVITLSSAGVFQAGDYVTYAAAAGNTAVGGLTSGATYVIQFANSTVVALTDSVGGSRITLTKGFTETGHTIQGTTATAVATVTGGKNNGIAHTGWVVRKVGTGGRAGRTQYEVLVTSSSITGDGSDDLYLPDA